MVVISLTDSIFKQDKRSKKIGYLYASTAQEDLGIEWIGRQSLTIAKHMLYLSVCQDAERACKLFNEIIGDYVETNSLDDAGFEQRDDCNISIPAIRELHEILERDQWSEELFIMKIRESILNSPLSEDAIFLVDLDSI